MSEHHAAGLHGRTRRRLGAAVCAAVLVGAIAGCSGNPEPQPLEDETAAASSTPSPSPTRSPESAPTLPPEAKGTSKKAAIAFVEHVIEVLNYSAKSLDTRALRRLSAPECEACKAIVKSVHDLRSTGGSITGGTWTPLQLRAYMGGPLELVQVEAVVDAAAQVVHESPSGEPVRHPAGKTVYVFDVERGSSGWTVLGIRGDGS